MTENRLTPDPASTASFLKDEKQYMRIKRERQLVDYQVKLFSNERRKMQKRYDALQEKTEQRKNSYGLRYNSRKELDEAYIAGVIESKEYMDQRSKLWLVYSDRGYEARLAWLDKMIAHYEGNLKNIDDWIAKKADEREQRQKSKIRKRKKAASYMRRRRRKARREAKEAQYRELKEKYKYYGLR